MQEVPTVDITTTDTSGSVVAASDAITSDIRAEFDIEVVQRDLDESADLLNNHQALIDCQLLLLFFLFKDCEPSGQF